MTAGEEEEEQKKKKKKKKPDVIDTIDAQRRQMRRPAWRFHAVAVLLLAAINIFLLIKLLHCPESGPSASGASDTSRGKSPSNLVVDNVIGDAVDVLQIGRSARWDNSRQFRIRDYVYVGRHFHVRFFLSLSLLFSYANDLESIFSIF